MAAILSVQQSILITKQTRHVQADLSLVGTGDI